MERIFQSGAVVLAALTAFFLWKNDDPDWAFAAGVLACVSFFLSIRSGAKRRLAADEEMSSQTDQDADEPADLRE